MKTLGQIGTNIAQAGIVIAILFAGWMIGWFSHPKCATIVDVRTDTVFVRDTIRDTVPVPRIVRMVRVDTVSVKAAGDTVYIDAEIPIERKTYETDDYKAEIEGFRPSLVSIEVYQQTQYINTTQTVSVRDTRRWGLGIQAGFGAIVYDGKIKAVPYIGVGVSYNLLTW